MTMKDSAVLLLILCVGCDRVGEAPRTLAGHQSSVRALAFNPNGSILASGDSKATLKLWDTANGREIRSIDNDPSHSLLQIDAVSFSPDGSYLASAFDGISIWDVNRGTKVKTIGGHQHRVTCAGFSATGNLLASASTDEQVILWDASSYEEKRKLDANEGGVFSLCFDPTGKILATGGKDSRVSLWNPDTGKLIFTLAEAKGIIRTMAFVTHGTLLAAADEGGNIYLWDAATGKKLKTTRLETPGRVAFCPDGRFLAVAAGRGRSEVVLWSLENNKLTESLGEFTSEAEVIAYSASGELLALGLTDGSIKLWRLKR
jgi:WD40 repeat protein